MLSPFISCPPSSLPSQRLGHLQGSARHITCLLGPSILCLKSRLRLQTLVTSSSSAFCPPETSWNPSSGNKWLQFVIVGLYICVPLWSIEWGPRREWNLGIDGPGLPSSELIFNQGMHGSDKTNYWHGHDLNANLVKFAFLCYENAFHQLLYYQLECNIFSQLEKFRNIETSYPTLRWWTFSLHAILISSVVSLRRLPRSGSGKLERRVWLIVYKRLG